MNEQLQNTINEMLTKAMEAFNNGADWLAGEIPDVISQLLIWSMVESILANLMFIVVITASIVLAIKVPRKAKLARENGESWTKYSPSSSLTSHSYDTMILGPYILLAIVVGIAVLCYTIGDMFVWLQILVAPKLYLLEYAAELIK